MKLRCVSRPATARLTVALLVATAALGWPGLAPASASAGAQGVERFARCEPLRPYKGEDAFDSIAIDYFVEEYGGSRKAAKRWLGVQAVADQIREVMRASPARRDFMNMSYDNRRKRVNIYVRHHGHDRAIRRCALEMRIERHLHIGLRKWSSGDLLRAIRKLEDAVPELYAAGGFECGYGSQDHYSCDVFRTVTDAQFAELEAAAKKIGVGYRLKRLDADPPTPELQ